MWCEPSVMCSSYSLMSVSLLPNGLAKVWHLKTSVPPGTVNRPIVNVMLSALTPASGVAPLLPPPPLLPPLLPPLPLPPPPEPPPLLLDPLPPLPPPPPPHATRTATRTRTANRETFMARASGSVDQASLLVSPGPRLPPTRLPCRFPRGPPLYPEPQTAGHLPAVWPSGFWGRSKRPLHASFATQSSPSVRFMVHLPAPPVPP